jgi:surface antigen
MKKILNLAICIIAFALSGCASNFFQSATSSVTSAFSGNTEVGGQLAASMDDSDKNKMFHALDKGLGKSTEWTSPHSGISYSVVPTGKLTVNGNPYCRNYQVTGRKNNQGQTVTGTACVSPTDSSWQVVN